MFDATIDHIDETSASLSDRARPQVANHVRSLPEQTLDALLRIEELLQRLVDAGVNGPGFVGPPLGDIIKDIITPTETPFTESLKVEPKKGKRK